MDAGIILPLGRPCSSHLTNAEHPVASWKEFRVDRPVDADRNWRNVATCPTHHMSPKLNSARCAVEDEQWPAPSTVAAEHRRSGLRLAVRAACASSGRDAVLVKAGDVRALESR